jgi:hypothetical protein
VATPWFTRVRSGKKLLVLSRATTWAKAVRGAVKRFNDLNFGVTLEFTDDFVKANIIVVQVKGPSSIDGSGVSVSSGADFKADGLHGKTALAIDRRNQVYFAGTFLPEAADKTTQTQKEMITLHEFIHAAGMDEHDSSGIMYDVFQAKGDGVAELAPPGMPTMPAVRVGVQTACIMSMLWADGPTCSSTP